MYAMNTMNKLHPSQEAKYRSDIVNKWPIWYLNRKSFEKLEHFKYIDNPNTSSKFCPYPKEKVFLHMILEHARFFQYLYSKYVSKMGAYKTSFTSLNTKSLMVWSHHCSNLQYLKSMSWYDYFFVCGMTSYNYFLKRSWFFTLRGPPKLYVTFLKLHWTLFDSHHLMNTWMWDCFLSKR